VIDKAEKFGKFSENGEEISIIVSPGRDLIFQGSTDQVSRLADTFTGKMYFMICLAQ
jgi:hypothetical protein